MSSVDEVQRVADYTAIINKGEIIVSGETEKLRHTSNTKITIARTNSKVIQLLPKNGVSYYIDGNKLIINVLDKNLVQEIIKTMLYKGYMLGEVVEEKIL